MTKPLTNPSRRLYTRAEKLSALQAFMGGDSMAKISKALGCHPKIVSRWVKLAGLTGMSIGCKAPAHRLALGPRVIELPPDRVKATPTPHEVRLRIVRQVLDGASPEKLAPELGVAHTTVRCWVYRYEDDKNLPPSQTQAARG